MVDLSGERFGKLYVVQKTKEKKGTSYLYECLCDCGNTKMRTSNELKSGAKDQSCGCSPYKRPPHDITGRKKNRLTAIENTGRKSSNRDYIWKFSCDCGGEVETTIGRFNSGHTKSCGCISNESRKLRKDYHGMQDTGAYNSWRKMVERCTKEYGADYPRYGGAGVTVCEEWKADFKKFYEDMGDCPEGFSLDRIDNSKGYYKDNCRWASREQQNRNKYGLTANNTSGHKGVQWEIEDGEYRHAIACWYDLSGKLRKRSFSVRKYGRETAFQKAKEARDEAIRKLNEEGAGYGEHHNIPMRLKE